MSTRRNRCPRRVRPPGALYAMFVAAAFTVANAVQAEDKEIVVGLQCDRTGPTQIVGTVLCAGYHDYIVLVNSRGGVEGHKIRVVMGFFYAPDIALMH